MKTAQKLGTAVLVGILALVFVYAQLSQFSYTLNYSQLPFATQETITVTAQPNTTILMAYGDWLSGENQLYMNNTNQTNLTIDVLVPINTTVGNYTKDMFILATNGTPNPNKVTFYFYLLNDSIPVNITVDLDADGYYNDTDCNDSNPDINPGEQEIPYNGIDDDCNPATLDEAEFSIDTDEPIYSIGDDVVININAANGSNITLNYSKQCQSCGNPPPYEYLSSQTITNGTYPSERDSPYSNISGMYLVEAFMQYGDKELYDSVTYVVDNSISLNIDGETTIKKGQAAELTAEASGGIQPYTYTWNYSVGYVINGSLLNRTFSKAGTYTQIAFVKDQKGNQKNKTVDVIVKNVYNIIFHVKDASTGAGLEGAEIEVEGEESKLTGDAGSATFYLMSGKKDVTIYLDGYSKHVKEYDIAANKTYNVSLTLKNQSNTSSKPVVTLISPANNAELTGQSVTFKFKVTDDKTNNCSLYIAQGNDNWFALKQSKQVSNNEEQSFTVDELAFATHTWKIECIATDNKSGLSENRRFTLSDQEAPSLSQQDGIVPVDDLVASLEQALTGIQDFDSEQATAAQALNFENKISDALDLIDRTKRDLADLYARKDLNEEEKLKKQEELITRVDELRTELPIDLQVKETKKFVKYIRKDELDPIINEYIEAKNSQLKAQAFSASTMELQKKITVSTTAQIVTIAFLDAPDKTITLVMKDLAYSTDVMPPNSTSNLYDTQVKKTGYLKLMEVVPKDVAQNIAMINFSDDYVVIKSDPLVQFELTDKLIYYIKNEVPLDNIQQTNTLLIDTTGGKTLSAVTGASVFEFSFEEVKNSLLIIVIIVIVMLMYFAITFKWSDKVKLAWFVATSDKQLHYLRVIINDAMDYLQTDNYEKAAFLYREIKLSYEKLSVPAQNTIYPEIVPVFNQLDVAYLKDLMEKINVYIRTNQLDKAKAEYAKLRGTYHKIQPEFKTDLYPKIEPIIKVLGILK